jgi:hypothetical protein
MADGDYPEDWQGQGWCCRACAVMTWNGMTPEWRRYFAADVAAQAESPPGTFDNSWSDEPPIVLQFQPHRTL